MRVAKMGFAAIIGGLACLGTGLSEAKANSINLALNPVTDIVNNGDGTRTFTYHVMLTYANEVQGGSNPSNAGADFFTLFDFQGLSGPVTTTGLLSSDFGFSTSLVGPTPAGQAAVGASADDGTLLNLTFTANLGSLIENNSPLPISGLDLGTFSATTTVGAGTNFAESYVAQDTARTLDDNNLLVDNGKSSNTGNVSVPFAANGPFITPLPVAAWGGMGLFSLIGMARIRRSRLA